MSEPFRVEGTTIADLHRAIQEGRTTCVDVVRQYLERVRAFNGVATMLVTDDGAPGTMAASDLLPDLGEYDGPPIEFGRMEATASDPEVEQQFGMVVGIEGTDQLRSLATLNIRGERSVTCKGDFDRHPDDGPLPEGAPAVCELFRRQPDALERAAELDAEYGSNPPLDELPMYGVVVSLKDVFDTKDMRSTGGGDAAYDIDFPARDHTLVKKLREKGAIIFAKAVSTEYNGRAVWDGGRHKPVKVFPSTLGYQRSTWAGTPVNVYDPTRSASLGSSSGSGTSVSADLCMVSLGEETRASCRGPANHNAVALILPHKGMISFHGGAIGSDIYCDRTGILGRSLPDCAAVLDALVEDGHYDPRDAWTTVPRSTVQRNYSSHVGPRSLDGMRIGVVRESMLQFPDTRATEPISTAAAREIKEVLAGRLGATLVESSDPLWTPDPEVEQMTVDFRRALARLVPIFAPGILLRLGEVPEGMAPIDYVVGVAEERIAPPEKLDIATVQEQEPSLMFRFHISQYLMRRAADWRERGFEETLADWKTLNARSKYWGDDQRARFENWAEVEDPRNAGDRQGIDERVILRELLRRVDTMVLLENRLDALVRLHTQLPPGKIGGAMEPGRQSRQKDESQYGPNAGVTEILVPAGYVTTVYDAKLALSDGRERYMGVPSGVAVTLPEPGLPFSLVFRGEPGREDVLLAIASAYEEATHHRVAPPAFAAAPASARTTGAVS